MTEAIAEAIAEAKSLLTEIETEIERIGTDAIEAGHVRVAIAHLGALLSELRVMAPASTAKPQPVAKPGPVEPPQASGESTPEPAKKAKPARTK